jgi:hypothetical protein
MIKIVKSKRPSRALMPNHNRNLLASKRPSRALMPNHNRNLLASKRSPAVGGQFYPGDKTELEREVKKYLGRGRKENVKACVVPHAGYMFSGKLAGEVIGKIKEKKTFIIIGVNHSGFGGKLSFSGEDFETPLSIVKNDVKLGKKILEKLKAAGLDADIDERVHAYEHSIEVELPFLQLSQGRFEIIPILPKNLSFDECRKAAKVFAEFVSEDVCVVVSSDFTHYGFNYAFVPFTENVKKNLYKLDKEIIDSIFKLNSKEVYEKAGKSTVCGVLSITILTEMAKIKSWKPELVDYYTSGDVVDNWESAVGYAGIVFRKV